MIYGIPHTRVAIAMKCWICGHIPVMFARDGWYLLGSFRVVGKLAGRSAGLHALLWAYKTIFLYAGPALSQICVESCIFSDPALNAYDKIPFSPSRNPIMRFITVACLWPHPSKWNQVNWLLITIQILSKCRCWSELKGKVFSLRWSLALILIESKAISLAGPLKRRPVGAPLVFTPPMTWPLCSISSTWTICPLSCLNLISRLISIVGQAPVTVKRVAHCQVCEKVVIPTTHKAGL